jgi:uncharacterized membrane protein/glutaredoxin
MIEVTLFSKPDCPLCDEVRALLGELAADYPHRLTVRDVTADARLRAELGVRVPLVEVGGRRLTSPVTRENITSALAVAQAIERTYASATVSKPGGADRATRWLSRHWLALFNSVVGMYVGAPFLAPVLLRAGFERPARWIYFAYSFVCHQLPFRSFFLFGPRATYPRDILLAATGLDPNDLLNVRTFVGNAATGFKVALCERDVAMYAGILLAGLVYALLRPRLKALHWVLWLALGVLPIALDGGSQLVSQLPLGLLPFRESTALLRTITGALFGVMSVWFAYPNVQDSMQENLHAVEHGGTGSRASPA